MIAELEKTPMPERIAKLPRDERGYPVPFFAVWQGGKPNLKLVDQAKQVRCAEWRLCGICGEPLSYWMAFVSGPKGIENRISTDPPMHEDCARYAMKVCPYLARPNMKRAADYGVNLAPDVAGFDPDRPEKMGMAVTRSYRVVIITGKGAGLLFHYRTPARVEWFSFSEPVDKGKVTNVDIGVSNTEDAKHGKAN